MSGGLFALLDDGVHWRGEHHPVAEALGHTLRERLGA